jgi:hypothetical protein
LPTGKELADSVQSFALFVIQPFHQAAMAQVKGAAGRAVGVVKSRPSCPDGTDFIGGSFLLPSGR